MKPFHATKILPEYSRTLYCFEILYLLNEALSKSATFSRPSESLALSPLTQKG
jgi:hypothetical protein